MPKRVGTPKLTGTRRLVLLGTALSLLIFRLVLLHASIDSSPATEPAEPIRPSRNEDRPVQGPKDSLRSEDDARAESSGVDGGPPPTPRTSAPQGGRGSKQVRGRKSSKTAKSTRATAPDALRHNATDTETGADPVGARAQERRNATDDGRWFPTREWIARCVAEETPLSLAAGEWANPWPAMVIGDCVKLCNCWGHPPRDTLTWMFKHVCHPASARSADGVALAEALGLGNATALFAHKTGNYAIVEALHRLQAARDPARFRVPDNDTLVVHLRLGDIVERAAATAAEMLERGSSPGFRYGRAVYRDALKGAREVLGDFYASGAARVHVRGGSHRVREYAKSRVYARCLFRALREAAGGDAAAGDGRVTMTIEGSPPEEDFFYVSHARRLVVSAGGYSNLMGVLAVRRGGVVVGRQFSIDWFGRVATAAGSEPRDDGEGR